MLLEIGPGRGDFLFHLASENPTKTVAAIEYNRKRFEKLLRRIEARGLQNVRLHFGDARVVLTQEFQDETFEQIFILFLDPWPKRRHAKHRLFQKPFLKELLRVLKPEGQVFIAHDDPTYVSQIQEAFRESADSFIFSEVGVQFLTFYADKWQKEGRSISSFSYRKLGCKSERDYLALPCVVSSIEDAGDLSKS